MDPIAWILSLVLSAAAWAARPRAVRCPAGHDLRTGIRADGRFVCWPSPPSGSEYDGTWGKPERSVQSTTVLASRLYCRPGSRPIVLDYRTVGCRE